MRQTVRPLYVMHKQKIKSCNIQNLTTDTTNLHYINGLARKLL